MKAAEISEKVHYIGVNDRVTHKFEGMWPLPAGVSYNSYLVVGSDKAAIIDGVESAYALEQIDHIKAILGDRCPDYLIINRPLGRNSPVEAGLSGHDSGRKHHNPHPA